MINIDAGLNAHLEEIIEIRRHLHMYPELSEEETETAAYIEAGLQRHRIAYRRTKTGNGIIAQIGTGGQK